MSNHEVCKNGHDLTNPESYYSGARGARRCRVCKKNEYAKRAAASWDVKRKHGNTKTDKSGVQFGAAHLRMLSIITQRERCATWWEREVIDREFAELQRMLGTVEA